MTIYQEQIKLVKGYEEANGSFAVDASGSLGSFTDIPFSSFQIDSLDIEQLEPNTLVQRIDDKSKAVSGVKTWQATGTIPLSTFTTRADDGVAAVQGPLGLLLKAIMGGERLGTGDTVNDVTPAVAAFTVATGSRFVPGSALAVPTGTGGALEAREIQAVSSNDITLKHALSSAPSNGADVLNAATYYMGAGDGSSTTTLQFAVYGAEPQDRWLLMGGYPTSVSLDLTTAAIPRLTVTWTGPYWLDGSASSTTFNAAIAAASYSNANELVTVDSYFRVSTVGTESLSSTLIDAPTITIAPNISYVSVMSPSGVQARTQPVRSHAPPVCTVTWRESYQDTTRMTARGANTDYSIHYQIGSSATDGCMLITVPTAQVVGFNIVEQDGLRFQETTVAARCDDDTTESSASAIGQSAFRIHLF